MIAIDILNFLAGIAVVFLGYKLCHAWIMGKKFSELKPLLYSFAISLAIIWIINIFTGFIK